MSTSRKEKLRLAKNSTTPEVRIQALKHFLGDDDAYDIFIDALNHRHVGMIEVAILGLSAYEDSRWEILLDLLDDEEFGHGTTIIRSIVNKEFIDLSTHINRLRKSIPRRQDSLSLIYHFSWIERYQHIADVLTRDSLNHHNFWEYGKSGFIGELDISNPLSLNIVKRMLFKNALSTFDNIVYREKNRIRENMSTLDNSDFKLELFGYFSTLVTLSNKYKEKDNNFDLKNHVSNLDIDGYSPEIISGLGDFLDLYLDKKLKTNETIGVYGFRGGEEIWWEESSDVYIELDS